MSDQNQPESGVPDGLPTFENCPDWGKGGQFIYDPITKTRTRVVTSAEPEAVADSAAIVAPASTAADDPSAAEAGAAPSTAPKKDKNRA